MIVLVFAVAGPAAWGGQILNPDGSLSSGFLEMKPEIGQKMTPLRISQSNNIPALLKQAQSPDEKDWDPAVARLKELGLYIQISLVWHERAGAVSEVQAGADIYSETRCKDCAVNLEVDPITAGNQRFTIVRSLDDLYLIDTQAHPVRAWYFGNEKGREGVTFTGVVTLDENHFRFIDQDNGEKEGTLTYRAVEVHDVDFLSQRQILTRGLIPEDTDNGRGQVLVIPQEVAPGVDWYWVFSFGKGGWVDESEANEGLYRTFVKQLLEAGFRKAGSAQEKEEWKALVKVAKAGGRLAYSKTGQPAVR